MKVLVRKSKRRGIFKILLFLLFGIVLFIALLTVSGYYGALKPISYLPETNPDFLYPDTAGLKYYKLSGSDFNVFVNERGGVSIKSTNGESIMSYLIYYALDDEKKEQWGLDSISVNIQSDSIISITGKGLSGTLVSLLLKVPQSYPIFDVKIQTIYSQNITVAREALVAKFEIPVQEVYRRNRQVDTRSFTEEYWLQKQGARFSDGKRSALIYNSPGLSSMQLNSKRNLLFLNLEYFKDHPHVYIPFQADSGSRWVDQSMAEFMKGSVRKNHFSICLNKNLQAIPRLMMVPYGFSAAYIFTEHGDGGNIQTHRAVYLGADSITDVSSAVGGFAGHKIPATKSVFYSNPESLYYSYILDDQNEHEYLSFLEMLSNSGLYDICLHTPEGNNSDRETLEEAISFMKDHFSTITWIDHGMFSGKNNRECFVADGLNRNSVYYAEDLWEKFNTRYFWNPAVELIRSSTRGSIKQIIGKLRFYESSVSIWKRYLSADELDEMGFPASFFELVKRIGFNHEMNSLSPDRGEAYPAPVFWLHPTRTGSFYSWGTNFVSDYSKLWKKNAEKFYRKELEQLERLIRNQGIFINHGYYCRNSPGRDCTSEINGNVILNPCFDKILENRSRMRDNGDLYVTTVRDLLNYSIQIENVTFSYLPDGCISVSNNNDQDIKGLSMIVLSSNVLVDGEIPEFKKIQNNTIFWFDIKAGAIRSIKLTPENKQILQ